MLLIFRILLVTLVGDAVYSDEQSKFTCNTLQPGCNNVCYDTFAPVSHLRFWVFQIVLVSTPSIFYIVYVLHKIAKDEKLESARAQAAVQGGQEASSRCEEDKVLLIYIVHVVLRSLMEIGFLVGQYYLYGFEVPHLFRCETYPCPNRTDCFVSRATEKTIFLNFMFGVSLGCFVLNIAELHYLGWVYTFRVLCSACCACCRPRKGSLVGVGLYSCNSPLFLQLGQSLQEKLALPGSLPSPKEKPGGLSPCPPPISLETDSTADRTSSRGPEDKERAKPHPGRGIKSWL
ncbi:CXG1 protein, partial [Atractosteus spatula]|nr:CXG1 protein [Atractosteus spatula]